MAREDGSLALGVAHKLVVENLLGFLLRIVLGKTPGGELGLVHLGSKAREGQYNVRNQRVAEKKRERLTWLQIYTYPP